MVSTQYCFLILFILFTSCQTKIEVDLIIHHAKVYTVDSLFSTQESFAIKDGKFIDVGSNDYILSTYQSKKTKDVEGKFIYPGFIDAHCHFYGYGLSLQQVNLVGTKSFEEVLEKVVAFQKQNNITNGWIVGRGWDQNDWEIKEFPTNTKLDSLFPTVAVILKRIDGHAALANSLALEKAGIKINSHINGGKVEIKNGKPTGIVIDNAVDIITAIIPQPTSLEKMNALEQAQNNCFQVGLTTVSDAGLDADVVLLMDSLQKNQQLDIRIYAMLNPTAENMQTFISKGIYKTGRLSVRAIKLYADGALGSRGAYLKEAYSDDTTTVGMLLQPLFHFEQWANIGIQNGYQVNTHCIGDAANHTILNVYTQFLKGKNNLRWRIEHAQVVDFLDMMLFEQYSVIPSVQPVHATSDMYWAKDRLGEERIKYAYAYKFLLKNAGFLAYGSDFPVESINPLYGFYAAVSRKDLNGFPEGGFQMENVLTRQEALKAMTYWAAYANFEEHEKGSIEKGKYADFVMLDQDIMQVKENHIPMTNIMMTFVAAKCVFENSSKSE